MTDTNSKNKYPSAFYAAAGVGELVYEQLRRLQGKAVAFGSGQAPQWKKKVAEFGTKVDANKVRETVVTGTQVAAEKATKVYDTLVARGEKAFQSEEPAGTVTPAPAIKKTAPVVKKAPSTPKKPTA